jgi:NDP-sugar pyrophosphorylase family protein
VKNIEKNNLNSMQIIIPMSGSGQRFKDAGYEVIKPLIEVNGKTFVEYVISLFDVDDQFIFICDENHLNETNLRKILLNCIPLATIVSIAPHKKGPVFAVLQAFDVINPNEACIINYCDFFMHWNYKDFLDDIEQSNCDGAIPCYTGFHPHLLHTKNVYAGCTIDDNKKLVEIKEKYSFEFDKKKGHHSAGTYYFKTGALMQHYIHDIITKNYTLNGEFYASMLYEQMLIDGKYIKVYDQITHFCQWGTPQDFIEFLQWQNIFLKHKNYSVSQHTTALKNTVLLMAMAGDGKRFVEDGYELPKPFIKVDNMDMYERALKDLPICTKNIYITKADIEIDNIKKTDKVFIGKK